jgi:hypothetical protein
MNSLVSTFLIGMLLASIGLNVHQWRGGPMCGASEAETNVVQPAAATPVATPVNIDVDQLGLSAEQAKMLADCGDTCCCQAMQIRDEVRAATVALQAACAAPTVDEEALLKLADNLCALREREVKEHVAALLAVRKVLKPEQLEELHKSTCGGCPE